MCGIVGLISKRNNGLFHADLEFFEQQLIVDMLRGPDSTGAFAVHKNFQASVVKHESHPMHLFMSKQWESFKAAAIRDARLVIGHNRKATKGSINNDNAHPFHVGKIVLVHNGTLTNHAELNKELEVDSHAICDALNTKGTIEGLKSLRGAWGLVWYNMEEQKLHAVTNGERPLSLVESDTLYYLSSEINITHFLMMREARKRLEVENAARLFPKNILHTWDLSKTLITLTTEDITDKIAPRVYSPPAHPYYSADVLGGQEDDDETPQRPALQGVLPRREMVDINKLDTDPAIKNYPIGEKVVVIPQKVVQANFQDGGSEKIALYGIAYIPGRPLIRIKSWLPATIDMAEAAELAAQPKLIGKMHYFTRSKSTDKNDESFVAFVNELVVDKTDKTWTGLELPETEAKMICRDLQCSKCQGVLNHNFIDITSINPKNVSQYRCTCHVCIQDLEEHLPVNIRQKAAGGVQ